MKTNQKLCVICGKEIISLGIENKIILNHKDKMEYDLPSLDAILDINDFKGDTHFKCRITCARYYVAGLASRRYATLQFDITVGNKTAYQAIEQLKKMNYTQLQSNGIYLFGRPGIGKTLLLAELCKNILNHGVRPTDIYWGNTPSILNTLRASFGKKYEFGEETAQEKILNRLKARYLFLDDLGTESATDWAKEILYDSLNYRYEEHLPLFVSSNLPPQALSEKLSDKFVSRLIEMCRPVSITGEDMRLKKAEFVEINISKVIPEFSYQMAQWDVSELKGGGL